MTRSLIAAARSRLARSQKQWLKARLGQVQNAWVRWFRSYDARDFQRVLREMGIAEGDTVLMHSTYRASNGFTGTPKGLIDALMELLGESGTLVMTSMPYTSSTREYLAAGGTLDVRRTPSQMGIITEIFRRSGALRSQSPTHPMLAAGANSERLLDGHEKCQYPCGPGSPLERMLDEEAKLLFFDVPFLPFTFLHYMEHRIKDRLPFALYEEAPMRACFVDAEGHQHCCNVFVFSREASRKRRVDVITEEMQKEGHVAQRRIGNTRLAVANMQDMFNTTLRLAKAGRVPFDVSGNA